MLVIPRIADVKRLRTPMGQRYQPGGVALASKTGESMELLGVRPYRAGDRVRDLHVRGWARTGKPVVREYQQEYFSRIGVVVDTDGAAGTPAQLEAAISLAAGAVAQLSRGEALTTSWWSATAYTRSCSAGASASSSRRSISWRASRPGRRSTRRRSSCGCGRFCRASRA